MLSLQLDISARRIVIVGGGKVATRKAIAVLAAGANHVTAVSPAFVPEFPAGITRIIGPYASQVLNDAVIVFAATDNASVNAAVVRDARAVGALTNRADLDDDATGDFNLPAKIDLGDVSLTISAGSPALSSAIRQKLKAAWDHRWSDLATAMKTLRPWIVAMKHIPPDQRRQIFHDLASDAAMETVERGVDALRAWIIARHGVLAVANESEREAPKVE